MNSPQAHGLVIGVDLGGTNIDAALADMSARLHHTVRAPTPEEPEEIVRALQAVIGELLGRPEARAAPVRGIGLACAGWIDATGMVVRAVNLRWQRIPLRDRVAATFGVPAVI